MPYQVVYPIPAGLSAPHGDVYIHPERYIYLRWTPGFTWTAEYSYSFAGPQHIKGKTRTIEPHPSHAEYDEFIYLDPGIPADAVQIAKEDKFQMVYVGTEVVTFPPSLDCYLYHVNPQIPVEGEFLHLDYERIYNDGHYNRDDTLATIPFSFGIDHFINTSATGGGDITVTPGTSVDNRAGVDVPMTIDMDDPVGYHFTACTIDGVSITDPSIGGTITDGQITFTVIGSWENRTVVATTVQQLFYITLVVTGPGAVDTTGGSLPWLNEVGSDPSWTFTIAEAGFKITAFTVGGVAKPFAWDEASISIIGSAVDLVITITTAVVVTYKMVGSLVWVDSPGSAPRLYWGGNTLFMSGIPSPAGPLGGGGLAQPSLGAPGSTSAELTGLDEGSLCGFDAMDTNFFRYLVSMTVNGADIVLNQSPGFVDESAPWLSPGDKPIGAYFWFRMPAGDVTCVATFRMDKFRITGKPVMPPSEPPPPPVLSDRIGCMDPAALNYDPFASAPGVCSYTVPNTGCMDPAALNYDPTATVSGLCIYRPKIIGCMDPEATNYNPQAETPGICIYTVKKTTIPGCMDPAALNYNPDATTQPAGACAYPPPPVTCTKPLAYNQDVETNPNVAIPVTLVGSSDTAFTYSVIGVAAHGTITGTAPNVVYTPDAGYYGTDSFWFKTTNACSDSDPAKVFITIHQPMEIGKEPFTGVDWDPPGKTKGLLIRWKDSNKNWTKYHWVSLGKQGQTNLKQKLGGMGSYRTRQYEIVHVDGIPCTIAYLEEALVKLDDTGGS